MTKEFKAFSEALEKVLSVSHAEIKRREAIEMAARRKAAYGRKRKAKNPSASGYASGGRA